MKSSIQNLRSLCTLGSKQGLLLSTSLAFSSAVLAASTGLGGGGTGNPGFAPGDLVGTLPAYYGGDAPADAVNNPALSGEKDVEQPGFLVFGPGGALKELIQSATGDGFVSIHSQVGTGLQGLVFHGDIELELNRKVLLRESFQTTLWVGPEFGNAVGAVSFDDHVGAVFALASGVQFDLPLTGLASTDALDHGAVSLDLVNRAGDTASLDVEGFHSVIRLGQDVPD